MATEATSMIHQPEVCCLVHTWLKQQGFTKTASIFVMEAKNDLQSISFVNGSVRNLNEILSDYARLKTAEMQRNNLQKGFFDNDNNANYFADVWQQFSSLMDDYKYYRKHCEQRNYHLPCKRRRLNDCYDSHENAQASEHLYELNTNRFNQILQNNELHQKMAQLIQTQFTDNKKVDDNKVADDLMNDCDFNRLFVPLPIEEIETQQQDDDPDQLQNENTNDISQEQPK
mmetsp:Transcript_47166/g.78273  ORF Transcript_47166/g.78273 Transcript_47166/m.78273 type:complete len:229 (+) Transcript_47166:34-720(+)